MNKFYKDIFFVIPEYETKFGGGYWKSFFEIAKYANIKKGTECYKWGVKWAKKGTARKNREIDWGKGKLGVEK